MIVWLSDIGKNVVIDIIDSAGKQEQYTNKISNMECFDLVFQQDKSLLHIDE